MSDSGPANKARRNMLAAALAAGATAPAMARLISTNSSGNIMAGSLLPQPKQLFQDANWNPLIGGKIYTYVAGTLTPKTTYQDVALTIANPNPTIANARGEVSMYGTGPYRVVLKDALGNTIYDVDNIESTSSIVDAAKQAVYSTLGAQDGASIVGFNKPGGGTVQQQLDMMYYGIANVLDTKFAGGADPAGVKDSTVAIQAAYNSNHFIHYPPTSAYYKISDTISYKSEHVSTGCGCGTTRVVMTDATKWAFACDPVNSAYFNNAESQGGGFFDLDIRARYGIRMGKPNTANTATYNYASPESFFDACKPVQQFRVERCTILSDIDYAAAYTYIAASPGWNTIGLPTVHELYIRGCGVFFANNYRGAVRDCQIKFFGMAVWLFGSDLSEVTANRLGNNLRHVHIGWQWASGAQCVVQRNDLLANYRRGGVFSNSAHNMVHDNYFENTGGDTNAIINYYIEDAGQTLNVIGNRFDDYGNTKTTGPIVFFAGVGGAICTTNRVADNRPGGAGGLGGFGINGDGWKPGDKGLHCEHGLVLADGNDRSFPRSTHPLVSYGLDVNDPLQWSPVKKQADVSYRDINGGGIMIFKFAQDASGLWYLNPAPFQNAINLKPRQDQLTKGRNFTITIRSRCILATAPFNVFWILSWINPFGVKTDLFTATKSHATNTAIDELSSTVTIPETSEGYFSVYIDESAANLYSISITPA